MDVNATELSPKTSVQLRRACQQYPRQTNYGIQIIRLTNAKLVAININFKEVLQSERFAKFYQKKKKKPSPITVSETFTR